MDKKEPKELPTPAGQKELDKIEKAQKRVREANRKMFKAANDPRADQ